MCWPLGMKETVHCFSFSFLISEVWQRGHNYGTHLFPLDISGMRRERFLPSGCSWFYGTPVSEPLCDVTSRFVAWVMNSWCCHVEITVLGTSSACLVMKPFKGAVGGQKCQRNVKRKGKCNWVRVCRHCVFVFRAWHKHIKYFMY